MRGRVGAGERREGEGKRREIGKEIGRLEEHTESVKLLVALLGTRTEKI